MLCIIVVSEDCQLVQEVGKRAPTSKIKVWGTKRNKCLREISCYVGILAKSLGMVMSGNRFGLIYCLMFSLPPAPLKPSVNFHFT